MRWANCCLLISSEKTAQGSAMIGGDVFDDVHRQRGFAHRRPGRDDDHLAVLQAVEHVVEFVEPGLQPALAAVFDHLEDFVQDFLHRLHRFADFFLRDVENSLLGLVQHEVRLLVRGIGIAQDIVAGGDQLPQHRLFADDPGVVHPMGGGGDGVENLRDVSRAADFLQKLPLDQFLAQDDRVDRPVLSRTA